MKKGILVLCAVALLVTFASAAMAADDYWVVKFKAGANMNASNNDTLIIGASAATAGGSDTFNASYGNIVSLADAKFIGTHRVAPVVGGTYTFTVLVAPGLSFPTGTGDNAGKVYISLWTPDSYLGSPGRSLPLDYTVSIVGDGVDLEYTRDQLYLATDPGTTLPGPVGFWYSYGNKSSSYTDPNADDIFTVTVAPVPPVITPEPGSILALGSGLVGFAGFALRRRRA